ncbi:MAG: hypothetical protein K2P84_08940, partial [Undibacterium sp.]|nr:hypothetical protein [Undibacterium sp.]
SELECIYCTSLGGVPPLLHKAKFPLKTDFNLTSLSHMKYLDTLVSESGKKLFFISAGVARDLNKIFRQYPELAGSGIEVLCKRTKSKLANGTEVHEIFHFSASQIHGQLASIRSTIDRWLESTHVTALSVHA